MKNSKHVFAFFAFLGDLANSKKQIYIIQDDLLKKRISLILRMKKGDELELFDHKYCAKIVLEMVTKKEVQYRVVSFEKIDRIKPEITVFLPLLKRDALEEAVSRLAILGVSKIQLLISEKSRKSISKKEQDRLEKIVIAAAEQSKQFAMPEIMLSQDLEAVLPSQAQNLFLFDQYGATSRSLLQVKYQDSIVVAFGPEGDFTEREKELLKLHNFISLSLTKSVLRTIDAVLLGVGLLRLV